MDEQQNQPKVRKKFIGVHFECCGVYKQIYYDEKRNSYSGYCPICHKKVNVRVDPEKGVNARFFRAH